MTTMSTTSSTSATTLPADTPSPPAEAADTSEITDLVNELCGLAWQGTNLEKFKQLLLYDQAEVFANQYNSRGQTALVILIFILPSLPLFCSFHSQFSIALADRGTWPL
jgi:hypothetical protein